MLESRKESQRINQEPGHLGFHRQLLQRTVWTDALNLEKTVLTLHFCMINELMSPQASYNLHEAGTMCF